MYNPHEFISNYLNICVPECVYVFVGIFTFVYKKQ